MIIFSLFTLLVFFLYSFGLILLTMKRLNQLQDEINKLKLKK